MSNRWNQTRTVNRRPKVCLSKHPVPTMGSPSGPCSITPEYIVRTIRTGTQTPVTYRLDSLNDVHGTHVPLVQDVPIIDHTLLSATVGELFVSSLRPIVGPGTYDVVLTAILPSGCNPTTRLRIRVTP